MNFTRCFRKSGWTLAAALAALLFLPACARTRITPAESTHNRLPAPAVIRVRDFSVSPDQVTLDHTIGLRLQELAGEQTDAGERLRLAQAIAGLVTTNVVQDLRKRGYNAVASAPDDAAPAAGTLTVEGQFFSIDQGSERRRMIIGFGVGASEVRVLVQAFETTPQGPELVDDFYATVKSSPRPGAGPVGGASAVVARKTAGGVLGLLGANQQSVEADARRLADSISRELQSFFARQGWPAARP